jgi:MarR family transcriptional regulator, organic hydroperoxide resistance regulator
VAAATGEDDFLERFNVLSNEEIEDLSQTLLKAQKLIIKM